MWFNIATCCSGFVAQKNNRKEVPTMGIKTKNYLVITIDSYDVFGIYKECESYYAMKDLYKYLKVR